MIGKGVGTGVVHRSSLPRNDLAQASTTGSTGAGDSAPALSLQPASPTDSGGPLQPLAQATAQPVAGQAQATPDSRTLARARVLISDFISATGRLVAGSDKKEHLVGRAEQQEKSLHEAITAGKSPAVLAKLTETAVRGHYELSQRKGTSKEAELKLLQKCLDMYDGVKKIVPPGTLHSKFFLEEIAFKAYALQMNLATGMEVKRDAFMSDAPTLQGRPCEISKVDLLGFARATSLHSRAGYNQPPGLNQLYTAQQLRYMPMGDAIDGNRLTRQEIDLLCADPPQNPWPVEPRLERFYDAARLAAREVRALENNEMRRELIAQHMPHNPDPELAARDNRANMADLIAAFAADSRDDPT